MEEIFNKNIYYIVYVYIAEWCIVYIYVYILRGGSKNAFSSACMLKLQVNERFQTSHRSTFFSQNIFMFDILLKKIFSLKILIFKLEFLSQQIFLRNASIFQLFLKYFLFNLI